MTTDFVFRHSIALATAEGPGPGRRRGFNAVVTVVANEGASDAIRAWIARVDHGFLGLDLDLGFEPTLDALADDLLRAVPGARRVEIERGDGSGVSRTRPR